MVAVRLLKVTKRFKDVVAVDKVTINIRHGEFFTFLGPSGCGKTTTLRLIAGLEYPDQGRIFFNDEDVTELPPYRRNTGMVFQNYALWPHMTVFDNIAYGLKIRGLPKKEIRDRVCRVLELIKLKGLEHRYPTQLSGGQQQRVALARALVIEPQVLLLDEPLSNLDAKLRIEMREEIKRLQRQLGITTIYVTHDQEEAMVISDRIAVMNEGKVMQVGTPEELYKRPKNLFVATFLGRCTVIEGVVEGTTPDGYVILVSEEGALRLKGTPPSGDIRLKEGERAVAIMRPQDFSLEEPKKPFNVIEGVVDWLSFVGPYVELRVNYHGRRFLINVPSDFKIAGGRRFKAFIPCDATVIFPLKERLEEAA